MFKGFLLVFKRIRAIKRRYIIGLAIAILLVVFFAVRGNGNKIQPDITSVERKDIRQEVSASGTLNGVDSVSLHFKNSGKLAYIKVKTGDKIAKWQVIAGLDTQDLETALRQAQNTLRDKRAIVDRIKDDNKDVTSETYAQRQTRTTAEVAQDNAYDSMLTAQKAVQDAVILAPIAGVVTKADFVPGENVSLTDTIAQVIDFSAIVFFAEVDEADIARIAVGQKAEITLNAYGDKIFNGKVSEIMQEAKTTSNGATVIIVKILLDDQAIKNIAGLNGQVNIVTSEKDNVLSIPLDALQSDNTVFVKTATGFKKQKVRVGFKSDVSAEITGGLKEGDRIVTNPLNVAKDLK